MPLTIHFLLIHTFYIKQLKNERTIASTKAIEPKTETALAPRLGRPCRQRDMLDIANLMQKLLRRHSRKSTIIEMHINILTTQHIRTIHRQLERVIRHLLTTDNNSSVRRQRTTKRLGEIVIHHNHIITLLTIQRNPQLIPIEMTVNTRILSLEIALPEMRIREIKQLATQLLVGVDNNWNILVFQYIICTLLQIHLLLLIV